jgi:hypothetical protein
MTKPMRDTSSESPGSAPAAELLQSHCRQLEAYEPPGDSGGETPAAPQSSASARPAPLKRGDLPAVMQALIDRYEASHPGTRLAPIRYVVTGFAESGTAVSGDALDGDVVSLSVTETMVDAEHIQVGTRVLIARRTGGSPAQDPRG